MSLTLIQAEDMAGDSLPNISDEENRTSLADLGQDYTSTKYNIPELLAPALGSFHYAK